MHHPWRSSRSIDCSGCMAHEVKLSLATQQPLAARTSALVCHWFVKQPNHIAGGNDCPLGPHTHTYIYNSISISFEFPIKPWLLSHLVLKQYGVPGSFKHLQTHETDESEHFGRCFRGTSRHLAGQTLRDQSIAATNWEPRGDCSRTGKLPGWVCCIFIQQRGCT